MAIDNGYDYRAVIAERARLRKKRRRKRRLIIALFCVVLAAVIAVIVISKLPHGQEANDTPDGPAVSDDTESPPTGPAKTEEELRIEAILADSDTYPVELQMLVKYNPETLDFVEGYPGSTSDGSSAVLTMSELSEDIPHFLQWDRRWGYTIYADEMLALSGCGPTCLAMVAVALTGDESFTPYAVAQYADENGYSVPKDGSKWTLMSEGCGHFGLVSEEIPLWKEMIDDALAEDKLVIICVGPGDFTNTGHFLVLCGVAENGEYVIRDPNSIARTASTWSYETLESQIRNIWAFEKTEGPETVENE